jgi:SAM-dependent methyltransferase
VNPCVMCGAADFEDLYEKQGHSIRGCRACGLVQLNPLPAADALENLYHDPAYFESHQPGFGYGDYAGQEREYLATFGEDVRRIAGFLPAPASILDVGCGYGYFMQSAAAAGYDVWGTDLADRAVSAAKLRFPDTVFLGRLSEISELEARRFDAIFASHLIEHIPDPIPFVRDLAARLRPGGLVIFVTPNIRSLLARFSRSRWVSFKIPEHVTYYDPASIRRLMDTAGLETVAVDPAYQHYAVPFVARRLRELFDPVSRLVPRIEALPPLRHRIIRITSGSLRVIARKAD